jgi:hypothetical protein
MRRQRGHKLRSCERDFFFRVCTAIAQTVTLSARTRLPSTDPTRLHEQRFASVRTGFYRLWIKPGPRDNRGWAWTSG